MAGDQESWLATLKTMVGDNSSQTSSDGAAEQDGAPNSSIAADAPPVCTSADAPATSPASTSADPAPTPPPASTSADDSDNFKLGYQDGLSGGDANPPPLSPDGMAEYQDGYAKGHYEFSQKNASNGPPAGPNSSEGPAFTPGPAPDTGPNQSVETPDQKSAYQAGYQDGKSGAPSDPIGRVGFGLAQAYTSGYSDGQKAAQQEPDTPPPQYDGPSVGPLSQEQYEHDQEAMRKEEEREERIREFLNEREDPHTHDEHEVEIEPGPGVPSTPPAD
jgi:hypothetical protein